MRTCLFSFLITVSLPAATPEWTRANNLYSRTEYQKSLAVLEAAPQDAATLQLIGQNFFMLGDYKKASDAFEKAAALEPNNAKLIHWLGRAYGRRAETSNPFVAPGLAAKTRQMLRTRWSWILRIKMRWGICSISISMRRDFFGGGMQKAEMLAQMILKEDPAEGHYAQGIVADRKKQYDTAEEQFRRAVELAPRQVGRVLVLARYLANHDHVKESDALFEKAARMAPDNPRVMFDRAATYIKEKRDLDAAKKLLERYVQSPLTPDDPPRERAEAMLKNLGA